MRIGNLKEGVNGVKNHRFFNNMDWVALLNMKIQSTHIPSFPPKDANPSMRNVQDITENHDNDNFPPIKAEKDLFLKWF